MVTVTALLIKRTCRGSLCEHRDDQLQNDKRKSAVDYKSTPSGKDVGLLDFKEPRAPEYLKRRGSLCMWMLFFSYTS